MSNPCETAAVADVYSGDALECPNERLATLFSYVIEVEPEPDALARVAMVFNLANTAPQRFLFEQHAEGKAVLMVAIPLVRSAQADMIRRKVAQLTCIVSVSLTASSQAIA